MADVPQHPDTGDAGAAPGNRPERTRAWWVYALIAIVVALLALMIVLHLTGVVGPGSN